MIVFTWNVFTSGDVEYFYLFSSLLKDVQHSINRIIFIDLKLFIRLCESDRFWIYMILP